MGEVGADSRTSIRGAGEGDYDLVISIWVDAGLPYKPKGRDSRERFVRDIRGGRSVYLLAADAGRPVGTVLVTHDNRKGWINRLAVVPSARRRGVATALLGGAEEWLFSQGLEIWAALIQSDNDDSKAFFAARGYVSDPEVEYFSRRLHPHT